MKRLAFVALFLCLLGPRAAADVTVDLTVRRSGANHLSVLLWKKPHDPAVWPRAFSDALGVALSDVAIKPDDDGDYWMEADFRGRTRLFGVSGAIRTAPLDAACKAEGVEPPVSIIIWLPADLPAAVSSADVAKSDSRTEKCFDVWPSAASVAYHSGHTSAQAASIVWPLLLVAALPILFVAWSARAALRSTDQTRAWFGHARSLRLAYYWALIMWPFTAASRHFIDLMRSACGWGPEAGISAAILALLVPLLIITAACKVVSWPVVTQVRGAHWSRRDLLQQAFWTLAAGPGALTLGAFGLALVTLGGELMRPGLLLNAAGVALFIYARRKLAEAADIRPYAAQSGEFRDATFALAEKAKVKLAQVYIVPAGRGLYANAAALSGNRLLVSEAMFSSLSKREVRAILAHEIAHLRKGHAGPKAILLVLGAGAFAGLLFALVDRLAGRAASPMFTAPTAALLMLSALLWISRRRERAADVGSAELTGDPEAMITGLVRLMRLNSMPVSWSRWDDRTLTHPSTRARAEALARRCGVSADRLEELLAVDGEPEDTYGPPAAERDGVFTTQWRAAELRAWAWRETPAIVITPAAFCWSLERLLGPAGRSAQMLNSPAISLVPVAASLLAAAAWGVAYSRRGRALARLRPALEERARAEGISTQGAAFVTMAPHGAPRTYEAFPGWDVGFLYSAPDRIAYLGERTRLELSREEVRAIRLVTDRPGWGRHPAVLVEWDGGAARFSALESAAGASARATEALANRLAEPDAGAAAPNMPGGAPTLGEVTSAPAGQGAGCGASLRYLFLAAMLSAAAAAALSLTPIFWAFAVIGSAVASQVPFLPYRFRRRRKRTATSAR
ncbi:MAG TPA: M48 family metalloprotease [Armatimonadota bacterium]|jgi:heat shock protein HtpX